MLTPQRRRHVSTHMRYRSRHLSAIAKESRLMLRLGLPAELDAGERTLLPLLIPPRDPLVRADGVRHLPHALAGIFRRRSCP